MFKSKIGAMLVLGGALAAAPMFSEAATYYITDGTGTTAGDVIATISWVENNSGGLDFTVTTASISNWETDILGYVSGQTFLQSITTSVSSRLEGEKANNGQNSDFTVSNVSSSIGSATVNFTNGNGGAGEFDFTFNTSQGSFKMLAGGVTLSWTLEWDGGTLSESDFGVSDNQTIPWGAHIAGLANGGSRWYSDGTGTIQPVPEPETWLMFLVGASLLGFRLRGKPLPVSPAPA